LFPSTASTSTTPPLHRSSWPSRCVLTSTSCSTPFPSWTISFECFGLFRMGTHQDFDIGGICMRAPDEDLRGCPLTRFRQRCPCGRPLPCPEAHGPGGLCHISASFSHFCPSHECFAEVLVCHVHVFFKCGPVTDCCSAGVSWWVPAKSLDCSFKCGLANDLSPAQRSLWPQQAGVPYACLSGMNQQFILFGYDIFFLGIVLL
jgi:hypothetical protein